MRRYVAFALRRPRSVLAVVAVVALGFGFFATQNIRVVTDLEALLPEGTPGVAALSESRRRIGSTDFFVIAIESASRDRAAVAALQDAVKARIEAEWQDAAWVQVDRDTSFFKTHALYYFDVDRLAALRDMLQEMLDRAAAESLPGLVRIADDDASESGQREISDWLTPESLAEMALPPQIETALLRFFTPDGDAESVEGTDSVPSSELADRLIDPEGGVGVVLVQLEKPSTDFDYAEAALARGDALLASVLPPNGTDLKAQVVGAYRAFKEVDAVAGDGRIATVVSAGAVLLLLLVFFRSARGTLALFFSLSAAAAVTMGVTAALFGRLTVFTVFVLALLAGMGIDFGIHLLGRIRSELRMGASIQAAAERAVSDTGAAMVVAALTTAACILVLLTGHFSGFREFAVIAAIGISLSLVSALLTAPALAPLVFPKPLRPVTARRASLGELLGRKTAALFVVGIATTFALLLFAPRVSFEQDFRNLRGPQIHKTIRYGKAVGKRSGTAPSVILGESRAQMEKVHALLLERRRTDPRINSFLTAATFVPSSEKQLARQQRIKEIGEIVGKRAMNRLRGADADLVDTLRTMCAASPFSDADLPEWTRRVLMERDGTYGAVGHLYAKISEWDAAAVQDFQDDYGTLSVEDRPVLSANSLFILADVVRMVRADGARLLAVSVVVLAVILGLFARSVRGALVLYSATAISAAWTVGLMGLFDIRIGLYNVIVIPVILGVSIDTAVHLYHRHLSLGATGMGENLRTTGLLISASTWTTFAGFSGLLAVSHLGLRSIGVLGCVGIAASWAATMSVLPYLLCRFVPAAVSVSKCDDTNESDNRSYGALQPGSASTKLCSAERAPDR